MNLESEDLGSKSRLLCLLLLCDIRQSLNSSGLQISNGHEKKKD